MHNLRIIFVPADINHSSPRSALLNYMLSCFEDSHACSPIWKLSVTAQEIVSGNHIFLAYNIPVG